MSHSMTNMKFRIEPSLPRHAACFERSEAESSLRQILETYYHRAVASLPARPVLNLDQV